MRILPDGYTQLEYIQSSGTQYIKTGVKHNQNTRIVLDAQVTQKPSTHAWLFGGRNNAQSAAINLFLLNGSTWNADYATSANRISFTDINALDRLSVDFDKNILTINGKKQTWSAAAFQSNYDLCLLADNEAGTISGLISAKIYSCAVYDNGILIRNYIPCKNPSGEVGLYDLANDVFYGNAGTGAFIAGLEFSYNEVEYIESTGTQYIDTGFKPNQNARFVCDFQNMDSSALVWLFGVQPSWAVSMFDIAIYANGTVHTGYGANSATISCNVGTERQVVDKNKNVTTIAGITNTLGAQTFQAEITAVLFAYKSNDGVAYHAKARVYSCQIYNNGTLIRDYVPVIGTDGVAGLWDKVEKVFYGNAGTGAFVAGAIIPEEPEIPPRKITVDLTPPMTGEKTTDFNIDYSVTDDIETESFTVVEYIDGEETQSRTVTAGETISTLIESTSMDDGLHTFMLIVDETVEVEYTFYVNNSTTIVNTTGVSIDLPAEVNINEKFLISVIVTELSFTIAKLKIHAGDIYSGEV